MFTNKVVLLIVVILTITVTQSLCASSPRIKEGIEVVFRTSQYFFFMFYHCLETSMPTNKFPTSDLKSYVNYPSITTVGYAPRFINNRKFLANLLSSSEFKAVLEKDEKQIKEDWVGRIMYCESVIMDQELIKAFINREVDQTKL